MTSQPTIDQLEQSEIYWAALREQYDQEALRGDSNELLDTIASAIWATGTRFHHPFLLDHKIHGFWYLVIAAAKSFHGDNPRQDTLVTRVLYIRELGIVTDKIIPENTEVILQTSNGQRIWSDLLYLLSDLESACTDASLSLMATFNLHSFVARLASVGVCGNLLTSCALQVFREALETPSANLERLLPAIRTWVFYAPYKLGAVVKSRLGEGNELSEEVASVGDLCREARITTSGLSSARWAF